MLRGGHIWSIGYYINTVDQYGTEEVIKRYVENQGRENRKRKLLKSTKAVLRYPVSLPMGSSFKY